VIEVLGVSKHYGRTTAVAGVSLVVAAGSSVVIAGPAGSGKTTLLRLIAGLERPDQGEIRLAGQLVSSPVELLEPHRRGIGFVFQSAALWPHMTVAANIRFGIGSMDRSAAGRRVDELLEATALTRVAKRLPHQVSGGEARRAALARALAPRPRYLLLDEPLTHLEAPLKAEMLALIRRTADEAGSTVIHVTHDLDEAGQVSDRVRYLEHGRLRPEEEG
jgi:ABC-type Fe3+/spermidine/putrescine transport system ATPase subunit